MCVAAAQAKILGPEDVFVKKGSTISLTCTVNVQSTPPSSVSWHHGGDVVDFDSPRYKPRESSSRVLPVNVPSPLARYFTRDLANRGICRQTRREKPPVIPFQRVRFPFASRLSPCRKRCIERAPIIFFHHP